MSTPAPSAIKIPPRYLGSVGYYAELNRFDCAYIDPSERFNKRDKATHRADIADANGLTHLTVPVEKPQSLLKATVGDIRISAHDEWWNIHFNALASAYGRTPFFEYYADDFRHFYSAEWVGQRLIDYTAGLDALVRRLVDIRTEIIYGPAPADCARPGAVPVSAVPYYQVRADRFGFLPGLSIADLLFNLGPESILILDAMTANNS